LCDNDERINSLKKEKKSEAWRERANKSKYFLVFFSLLDNVESACLKDSLSNTGIKRCFTHPISKNNSQIFKPDEGT